MLLFVAADPRECAGLVSHWQGVNRIELPVNWARSGRWKGRDVMAIANGAGGDRAFAAVLVAPRPSAICNIGFCGALDENLGIGDVFVANAIRNGAHVYETLVPRGKQGDGSVASVDHVVRGSVEKRNLRAGGASIVEMEAAGVARAAEDLGLPLYCIRAVSDLAGEDLENDFNAALMPDGRFSVLRLIVGACASPVKRFGELIRLQQRTALAARKLGDFLAECSF